MELLAAAAEQDRDDRFLRAIRARQQQDKLKRKAETGAPAETLRKAARAEREETERARAERKELERRAALDDIAAKRTLEEVRARTAVERRRTLEAARTYAQEVSARRDEVARRKSDSRWLQTKYPVDLANSLLKWRSKLSAAQVAALREKVSNLQASSRCNRSTTIPQLWEPHAPWTTVISHELGMGKTRIAVRCTPDFEWLLFGGHWRASSHNDCTYMLMKLVDRIVPQASGLFRVRYTARIILGTCDGVLEQCFVYCMILLSKWLGVDAFPAGVHEWPPTPPAALPPLGASEPIAPSSSS